MHNKEQKNTLVTGFAGFMAASTYKLVSKGLFKMLTRHQIQYVKSEDFGLLWVGGLDVQRNEKEDLIK